jgi:hypothetical protein
VIKVIKGVSVTYLLGFHYPLVSLGLDGSSVKKKKANTIHFDLNGKFPDA